MSRQIDPSKPLSAEDRLYLINHGEDGRVAAHDARFPDAVPDEVPSPNVDPGFTGDGTRSTTDPGAPPVPSEDEDEDPGYEEWSAEDLRAEIDERNENRETKISKAGSRADMAARLRKDDEEASA